MEEGDEVIEECQTLDIRLTPKAMAKSDPWGVPLELDGDYECFEKEEGIIKVGKLPQEYCKRIWNISDACNYTDPAIAGHGATMIKGKQTYPDPPTCPYHKQDQAVADLFWLCNIHHLRSTLPEGWTGRCARVQPLMELVMFNITDKGPQKGPETQRTKRSLGNGIEKVWPRTGLRRARRKKRKRRKQRSYEPDPQVYVDGIGQPRNIPHRFKARNEVAAGFESILLWLSVNKNTEWLNFIYYNQQRFINYTDEALAALGEQLDATSLMSWQNRKVLDWILAEQGQTCAFFGKYCCSYIPRNTAPNGTFTIAMKKLRGLRKEVTEITKEVHAQRNNDWFTWLGDTWENWKATMAKGAIAAGMCMITLAVIVCCCIPILRACITSFITSRMTTTHRNQMAMNIRAMEQGLELGRQRGLREGRDIQMEEFFQMEQIEEAGHSLPTIQEEEVGLSPPILVPIPGWEEQGRTLEQTEEEGEDPMIDEMDREEDEMHREEEREESRSEDEQDQDDPNNDTINM